MNGEPIVRNETKMLAHLTLDSDFLTTIEEAMKDELEIAAKKWKVQLNHIDQDNILYHTRNQLRRKVSEMAGTTWDMGNKLTVKVASPKRGIEITLPAPQAEKSNTRLVYNRDGWTVDDEKRDESVKLADFVSHIQSSILIWARTGVFYGVASYTI